jgi:hypothetical protein
VWIKYSGIICVKLPRLIQVLITNTTDPKWFGNSNLAIWCTLKWFLPPFYPLIISFLCYISVHAATYIVVLIASILAQHKAYALHSLICLRQKFIPICSADICKKRDIQSGRCNQYVDSVSQPRIIILKIKLQNFHLCWWGSSLHLCASLIHPSTKSANISVFVSTRERKKSPQISSRNPSGRKVTGL